jgi:hypothetical protein
MYQDVPKAGGFYEQILLDSLETKDSTYLLEAENLFQLKLLANDSSAKPNRGILRSLSVRPRAHVQPSEL